MKMMGIFLIFFSRLLLRSVFGVVVLCVCTYMRDTSSIYTSLSFFPWLLFKATQLKHLHHLHELTFENVL